MKTTLLFVAILGVFPNVLRCSAETAQVSEGLPGPNKRIPVVVVPDVEVGRGGGRILRADLAYPGDAPSKPRPAVLWIHGGGWSNGSHKGNGAQWLADHGYFTMSVEYRLVAESPWPAQLEDCKLAVRWLRAHAARYHVDPDRIGVWGSSAGGHLAACLGTMNDLFEGEGGFTGQSSAVQAVADFYGPVDFTGGGPHGRAAYYHNHPVLKALFGGSFDDRSAVWKEGSPITHVDAKDPPFFIAHGDQDRTVPISQSKNMADALSKAGIPVELVVVKGAGHGMKASEQGPAPVPDPATLKAKVLAFFDRCLK